jgi:lysozyme family protein
VTIDDILNDVLKAEGGFVNDPSDRGGATNMGITMSTLASWRRKTVTVEEVKALTEDEARDIYRAQYFVEPGYASLPEALWPMVVDAAVNHGPSSATRMLQRALGVNDDGVMGPMTLAMVKTYDVKILAARFVAQRARKYGKIISGDPSQAKFAAGWMNRLATFIERLA